MGLNARIGYAVPFVREPFRLNLMGGIYYTTMFTQLANFGFQNLMGPQVFPIFRVSTGPNSAVSVYLKYSPFGSGFNPSLASHELAGGLSYAYRMSSLWCTIGLDLAALSLDVDSVRLLHERSAPGAGNHAG